MALTKVQKQIEDLRVLHDYNQSNHEAELNWYKSINDHDKERITNSKILGERQALISEMLSKQNQLSADQEIELQKLIDLQKKGLQLERETNTQLEQQKKKREAILGTLKEITNEIKNGWKYLMEQDKVIKSTILNLGMSGIKAIEMRDAFEKSAYSMYELGGSLEDTQKIMEGYADETGRARLLSSQMVIDIESIAKGTSLGVEAATKLGAQFEIMGFDARKTVEYVQGIVDTSERMGVNTTKVLKNINDNFKRLNTMTFQKGSKGMAEMAMYAEKSKVSMESVMKVADMGDSLEKVIELTANLQVMGGEFAKVDPMQMFYEMRNEPEKVTERISEMTKGIATFRKQADGTFEKFISPADKQRLASVAESLGIAKEEMFEIAKRRLDMDKMNRDMAGMGMTKAQKELIQGAAIMDAKTMKYQVMVGGHLRDVQSLTIEQAAAFESEQKLLKERAKESQTFDEVFKITIMQLKSALLPLLQSVNKFLMWVRPIVEGITKWATEGPNAWMKVVGGFLLAGALWKSVTIGLGGIAEGLKDRVAGAVSGGGQSRDKKSGRFVSNKNAGKGMMRGGAGIGAAALGVGAGIGAAAAGISLLADAMAKLKPEQAKALQGIVTTITIAAGVGVAAGIAIGVFSTALEAASPAIAAFGAALIPVGVGVGLIGAGIGLATAGMGVMFSGIGKIVSGAGDLAKGVGSLVSSFSDLKINKETLSALNTISSSAPNFKTIGTSFAQISQVLSGSKDDWIAISNAITAISNANLKGGGMIADLANLMKKPLKVEFSDKAITLKNNITLEIDRSTFMHKVYDAKIAVRMQEADRTNKPE